MITSKKSPGYFVPVDEAGNVGMSLTGSNVTLVTRDEGVTDFATGSVTVGAAAIELKVGASPLEGRKQLIVYPPAAGVIYWGKSDVTAATGAPLAAGDPPLTIGFDPAVPVSFYAINDGTNHDVKVVETK